MYFGVAEDIMSTAYLHDLIVSDPEDHLTSFLSRNLISNEFEIHKRNASSCIDVVNTRLETLCNRSNQTVLVWKWNLLKKEENWWYETIRMWCAQWTRIVIFSQLWKISDNGKESSALNEFIPFNESSLLLFAYAITVSLETNKYCKTWSRKCYFCVSDESYFKGSKEHQ